MKLILLICVVLTTLLVYSAVAAPSNNAAPDIDMDLDEEQCRICHDSAGYLRNTDHYKQHNDPTYSSCSDEYCHNQNGPKKLDCMKSECHDLNNSAEYPVTNHHEFDEIFGNDDWTCFTCHERGVPRPLD